MNLEGRRESSNVEDRRGMGGGKKAGLAGIGGVIIAMAIAYFTGGNPLEAGIQAAQQNFGPNTEVSEEQREFTDEEQELATFSWDRSIVLATRSCTSTSRSSPR